MRIFFRPRFTVGEARDLGPRYTCSDELSPLRDESVERVSQCLHEIAHTAVEGRDPVQAEPTQLEKAAEPEAHVQDPV